MNALSARVLRRLRHWRWVVGATAIGWLWEMARRLDPVEFERLQAAREAEMRQAHTQAREAVVAAPDRGEGEGQ